MHASAVLRYDEVRKNAHTISIYYTAKSVGMQHIFVMPDKLFL